MQKNNTRLQTNLTLFMTKLKGIEYRPDPKQKQTIKLGHNRSLNQCPNLCFHYQN